MVDADISQFTGINIILTSSQDERRRHVLKIVWTFAKREKGFFFSFNRKLRCVKSEHNAIENDAVFIITDIVIIITLLTMLIATKLKEVSEDHGQQ